MNFYLSKNDQKLGPYSVEQIQIFLKQGLVTTADLVWTDGWPSWMAIGNVPGLSTEETSAAVTSIPPPQSLSVAGSPYATGKNPVVACILSLVIVGTGQFYNGDWAKGWIMLATCIFASFFSFGACWLFWALFSAYDAYRVADRRKPLYKIFPVWS